jgi:hypothetical protein
VEGGQGCSSLEIGGRAVLLLVARRAGGGGALSRLRWLIDRWHAALLCCCRWGRWRILATCCASVRLQVSPRRYHGRLELLGIGSWPYMWQAPVLAAHHSTAQCVLQLGSDY